MNTVQLSQRLAARLNVPDTADLEAEPALDVLAAMNAGTQAFYESAPPIWKRTTLSHVLRAPADLTVTFAAQYGATVADDTFTVAQFGCTVRFASGVADTQITGTNSVLDDFLGATLVQPATVYHDAIPIQDVIERIIGHVRLYDGTRAFPTPLYRAENLRAGRGVFGGCAEGVTYTEPMYPYDANVTGQLGRPRYYYLEAVGASQGGEPEFLLRVFPLPLVDYTVRMEAELGPRPIVFADLSTAAKVSVPVARIESALIPLCEAALAGSRFWRDRTQVNDVLAKAAALQTKLSNMTGDLAPTRNRVGTPVGY